MTDSTTILAPLLPTPQLHLLHEQIYSLPACYAMQRYTRPTLLDCLALACLSACRISRQPASQPAAESDNVLRFSYRDDAQKRSRVKRMPTADMAEAKTHPAKPGKRARRREARQRAALHCTAPRCGTASGSGEAGSNERLGKESDGRRRARGSAEQQVASQQGSRQYCKPKQMGTRIENAKWEWNVAMTGEAGSEGEGMERKRGGIRGFATQKSGYRRIYLPVYLPHGKPKTWGLGE
ncbi:hypothetical protein IWZ03DRAFT_120945 [Phyllosticta citriasiana]|uniref:Uncharacterized protein n=1 Tax=Phyllosticta citriasiana TaxID=595635 RepID=A0ABR1KXZ2_9PEZI